MALDSASFSSVLIAFPSSFRHLKFRLAEVYASKGLIKKSIYKKERDRKKPLDFWFGFGVRLSAPCLLRGSFVLGLDASRVWTFFLCCLG